MGGHTVPQQTDLEKSKVCVSLLLDRLSWLPSLSLGYSFKRTELLEEDGSHLIAADRPTLQPRFLEK